MNHSELFNEFKEKITSLAIKMLKETGTVPLITAVIIMNESDEKGEVMIAPCLEGDKISKENFIENFLSALAQLERNNKKIIGTACFYEMWLRSVSQKDFDFKKDNWKDLPKTEGLLISFENQDESQNSFEVYDIIRSETLVATPSGDLINDIEISPNSLVKTQVTDITQVDGILSNLMKKYKELV